VVAERRKKKEERRKKKEEGRRKKEEGRRKRKRRYEELGSKRGEAALSEANGLDSS
jgi:hypothetical protein